MSGTGSFEVAQRHAEIVLPPHSFCLIPVSFNPGSGGEVALDGGVRRKVAAVLRVWSAAARPEERELVARKGVRLGAVALLVGRW